VCCSKIVVHLFTFWEKMNIAFSLFFKLSPLHDIRIRFPLDVKLKPCLRSFSRASHALISFVCCFRSLFSKLQICSDKSFIRFVSGCHVQKAKLSKRYGLKQILSFCVIHTCQETSIFKSEEVFYRKKTSEKFFFKSFGASAERSGFQILKYLVENVSQWNTLLLSLTVSSA